MVGLEEGDFAGGVREAQGQDFGHEFADLARRKIYDGGDLAAGEGCRGVVGGDLGAGFFEADGWAEIDGEFQGGFAGFGEDFGGGDGADADVHGEELIEADGGGGGGGGIGDEVHEGSLAQSAGLYNTGQ